MSAPIREFLQPRVAALVREAVAAGMPEDAVVAVLIDIVTSPEFDTAAPPVDADSAPQPGWERTDPKLVMVNDSVAASVPTIGVQAEDDVVAPPTIRD